MSPPNEVFEVEGEEGKYFKTLARDDGSRRLVDFVLVSEERPDESNYSSDCKKRETFISQLEEAGLEIEEDEANVGSNLRFTKLHLPMEVLKRYAEILKLRLKLKGNLQNTVQGSSQSWLKKTQRLFSPKPCLREHEQEFSATYSRDQDYLFEDDSAKFFSPAARSRIVEFILQRERFLPDGGDDSAFGFNRLVNDGVYLAGYPLHDGTINTPGSQRQLLSQEWACWTKLFTHQPLGAIRDYYGVKIGIYFAWLGFYTAMLIPPSIAGVICLVYGWATMDTNIPALDICEGSMANTTMCPQCDKCEPMLLKESCDVTWLKYLFDNDSIVFFGFFMSLWAAVFLEGWKWYSAEIFHQWDVFGFDPEEEHPRPAYLLQLKDVKSKSWQVRTNECIEVKGIQL